MFFLMTYGTLMNGRSNHHYLRNQRYVGTGKVNGYRLLDYIHPDYMQSIFPVVFKTDNDEDSVVGEVYQCDDNILPRVDNLEGEGELYKRVNAIVDVDNGYRYNCYIYIGIKNTWKTTEQLLITNLFEGEKWKPTQYPMLTTELIEKAINTDIKLNDFVKED